MYDSAIILNHRHMGFNYERLTESHDPPTHTEGIRQPAIAHYSRQTSWQEKVLQAANREDRALTEEELQDVVDSFTECRNFLINHNFSKLFSNNEIIKSKFLICQSTLRKLNFFALETQLKSRAPVSTSNNERENHKAFLNCIRSTKNLVKATHAEVTNMTESANPDKGLSDKRELIIKIASYAALLLGLLVFSLSFFMPLSITFLLAKDVIQAVAFLVPITIGGCEINHAIAKYKYNKKKKKLDNIADALSGLDACIGKMEKHEMLKLMYENNELAFNSRELATNSREFALKSHELATNSHKLSTDTRDDVNRLRNKIDKLQDNIDSINKRLFLAINSPTSMNQSSLSETTDQKTITKINTITASDDEETGEVDIELTDIAKILQVLTKKVTQMASLQTQPLDGSVLAE